MSFKKILRLLPLVDKWLFWYGEQPDKIEMYNKPSVW